MTLPKRELTGEPAGEGSGSSSGSGNGNRLRDFRLDRLEVSTNNTAEKVDALRDAVVKVEETLKHVPTKAYILSVILTLGIPTLIGVMAPYWGSAFGTFLMRQTFRAIPPDFEEAALIDGASWGQVLWLVLLPLAKPGLIAFSIVSVVFHWNEYLWPLMVISDPDRMVLTVGLVSFALGAEGASDWGLIAAGTLLVVAPLGTAFVLFQRRFVNSFMSTGIK